MKIETTLEEQPAQKQVGRALNRLEARSKVTGRAEYIHNLVLPRMLYGKIFRSAVAHGRIVSIDTSAARDLEGVFAVYTGEDEVDSKGRVDLQVELAPDSYSFIESGFLRSGLQTGQLILNYEPGPGFRSLPRPQTPTRKFWSS